MVLRRICTEAGISPGTFTAHFGTLESYRLCVLENWYEPLRSAVAQHCEKEGDAIERLKAEIKEAVLFIERNAGVIVQLIMDALSGEASVSALLKRVESGHIAYVLRAIEEAQREGYLIQKPAKQVLFYLIGAIGLPTLLFHATDGRMPDDLHVYDGLRGMATGESMMERLEWALKGITL